MRKIIFGLVITSLISWPIGSMAISFNSQEISGIVKITSNLAKESIDLQVRSLKDFFTMDEASEYRDILEEQVQAGTGFFVTYSGCALTNKHVVYDEAAGAYNQNIHFWTTDEITKEPQDLGEAKVVYLRKFEDMALVCLEAAQGRFFNRTFVKTDDYKNLKLDLGEEIYILGYPESGNNYLTLTSGIISGKWDEEIIKTTTSITSGASGSPVFNEKKQVIGIAQANTGPFDQLGLFLAPTIVLDWFEGYQQVYRETLREISKGCMNTEMRGIYQKDTIEYYDLSCESKRNFGLEAKVAFEYKNYCSRDLMMEDVIAASAYINDGRSTINHWVAYLESSCLSTGAESVFEAGG